MPLARARLNRHDQHESYRPDETTIRFETEADARGAVAAYLREHGERRADRPNCSTAMEARRAVAFLLLLAVRFATVRAVATAVGVSERSLHRWIARYGSLARPCIYPEILAMRGIEDVQWNGASLGDLVNVDSRVTMRDLIARRRRTDADLLESVRGPWSR